jgi:hypothetical protein
MCFIFCFLVLIEKLGGLIYFGSHGLPQELLDDFNLKFKEQPLLGVVIKTYQET